MNIENDINQKGSNVLKKVALLTKIIKTTFFIYSLLKNIFIIYLFYKLVSLNLIF